MDVGCDLDETYLVVDACGLTRHRDRTWYHDDLGFNPSPLTHTSRRIILFLSGRSIHARYETEADSQDAQHDRTPTSGFNYTCKQSVIYTFSLTYCL